MEPSGITSDTEDLLFRPHATDTPIGSSQPVIGGVEANLAGSVQTLNNEADFSDQLAVGDEEVTPTELINATVNPTASAVNTEKAAPADPEQVTGNPTISSHQSIAEVGQTTGAGPVQITVDQTYSAHKSAVGDGAIATDALVTSIHQSATNSEEGKSMNATVDLVAPKGKKKRKPKSKAKHGRGKPTGFEEYYVDAPITPKEFEEEKALYDSSKPLIYCIEDAILRYQKNRRLEPDRREVFLKYLAYGGVDVGPKMFAGVDERELQQLDSEQALIAKGQASIHRACSDLTVDFNAVVTGYLTSYFPYFFNPESEDMVKLATVTIRNFLSYLLYHNVCPKYKENIDEARKSCDIANKELWQNQKFATLSPGDFNKGCSTLFGGYFYNVQVEENNWNKRKDTFLMKTDVAHKVVKFALAGSGTDAQALRFQELVNQEALHCALIQDIHGFEVTAVSPPTPDVHEFYKRHAPDLNPVGKLMGRAYLDPGKPRYDFSVEDRLQWEREIASLPDFEFFLEEDLLKLCYVGMKVITQVWELNCGFNFFEDVHTVYCSNYTVLCNDLMLGWKKPVDSTAGGQDDADETEMEDDGAGKKGDEKAL
ncbi:hypothetical protein ETB97_002607 [Aspergillus alliaceus]|uniref:Argonaute complex, subunit Arb1 n=1 Tax=Petromyces alliaceus TaxID=209559 RepID=A0A8H6E504_PETAA|nr:hypothetical protein ETB97_002607 [Aspergillus burnettii]